MPHASPSDGPRARRIIALVLLLAAAPWAWAGAKSPDPESPPSLLDHRMKRITGEEQTLSDYHGQVLLIVNVASKCGLTPQYEALEKLYEERRKQGFAVLGFPSNDFAGQEPGSDAQIADFCRSTYGVRFPMFSKIAVKGDGMHPLYRQLTGLPAPIGGEVQWNFQKYLVDRRGEVVARFAPRTPPDDPALLARIDALLAEAPPEPD